MTNDRSRLTAGLVLALLTLVFGFGLGGTFGAFEDNLKDSLKASAEEVRDSVYQGDEAQMKKITDKAWVYFKRAHLHANGLGTAALVLMLLLGTTSSLSPMMARLASIALGLGALGYSSFWLFAGMRAPGLGGTGLAKESLEWLAVPSAGLCIIGLLAVLAAVIFDALGSGSSD